MVVVLVLVGGCSGRGVVVVGAWGYPPSWHLYDYGLVIGHRAFSRIGRMLQGSRCTSCCSTLVLASLLREYLGDYCVRVLVFGLDSVVDPNTSRDLRKEAREQYLDWTKQLLDNCSCCGNLGLDDIEVTVLPGIGSYYGFRFNGMIDHLFNKAFAKITQLLSDRGVDWKWVFLDLTHGLNFQMIAVLYATIASLILYDKEKRLIMLNSEPPGTLRGGRCIESKNTSEKREYGSKAGGQIGGELTILDVSRLHEVIRLVRMLNGLKRLETGGLRQALRELSGSVGEAERIRRVFEDSIIPFFTLLRNGLVALAYPKAYVSIVSGEYRALLPNHPCREEILGGGVYGVPEYEAEVDLDSRTVSYPSASVYESLGYALKVILDGFCRSLCGGDCSRIGLLEFMGNVIRVYRDYGYVYAENITSNERQNLNTIIGYLKPALIYEDGFTVYTYRLLWSMKHHLTRILSGKSGSSRLQVKLEDVEETIKRQLEEQKKKVDDNTLRNAIAHSGLEFSLLEGFTVSHRNSKIIVDRILYSKKAVELVNKITGTRR